MKMIKALQRDANGACAVIDQLIDSTGKPTIIDGFDQLYEFTARDIHERVCGWGDLDGPVTVWEHNTGAYAVLIPLRQGGK